MRWLVAELIDAGSRPEATVLWQVSRTVPAMRDRTAALIDDLVTEARSALGLRSPLRARAVIVTALAAVHEIALPTPTATRQRVTVHAVLAVARQE